MSIVLWVALFGLISLLCAWIVFGDGADTAVGFAAALWFGGDLAWKWTEEGIRLVVGLCWILLAVWFAVGLFVPESRSFW